MLMRFLYSVAGILLQVALIENQIQEERTKTKRGLVLSFEIAFDRCAPFKLLKKIKLRLQWWHRYDQ